MSSLRYLALLIVLLGMNACATTPATSPLPDHFADGSVLVVIDDPRSDRRKRPLTGGNYRASLNYDIDPLLDSTSRTIAASYNTAVTYQWPIQSLNVHCFVVQSDDPDALIAQLNADSRVRFAQPVNTFFTNGQDTGTSRGSSPIAQSSVAQSFHSMQHFGLGQKIAVVDTGADLGHPDLLNANVFALDLVGPTRGYENERHGTAVVGLIGAQHQNGIGIDGAAPAAHIGLFRGCWQLRANSGRATCDTVALALALESVATWQPDVLNLSLSGPHDLLLETLVEKLVATGTVVVAAFDEQRTEAERFPQPRPGVLYAYGTSEQMPAAKNSAAIALARSSAFTLQPDGRYDVVTGHSMAAPVVSAIAALTKEVTPDASHAAVRDQLERIEAMRKAESTRSKFSETDKTSAAPNAAHRVAHRTNYRPR
ncbi:MAG: S8 family serine peptidase [Gammaproteobacteria bacterium]